MIDCKGLVCGYGKNAITSEINLQFQPNQLHLIVGNNGVGKSTFLTTIMGQLPSIKGEVLINNKPVRKISYNHRAKSIAFVKAESEFAFQFSVYDLVAFGRFPYRSAFGSLSAKDRAIIYDSLRLVGIEQLAQSEFSQLSDGQKQRVLIARALAQETPVILLDEPTSHLDMKGKIEVLKLLKQFTHKGKTILFTSHNLELALQQADTCTVIKHDRGIVQGTPQEIAVSGEIEAEFCGRGLHFNPEFYHFYFKEG